jgi:hypothetical protein
LALTPTSPKDSSLPPSANKSPRIGSDADLAVLSPREHRGSSSSDSSVSSDVGENGFLVLTPVEKGTGLEIHGLNKIEEEAVE